MSDKPIIFSAPMIRALLAGRKTQTRRLLKPQPPEWATFCQQPSMLNVEHCWVPSGLWRWSEPEQSPPRPLRAWPVDADGEHYWLRLPFATGDRLYVREAWAPLAALTHNDPGTRALCDRGFYRADNSTVDGEISRWRPSIHQPRWASRLTLLVAAVKVERLQDISEADAEAEGAMATTCANVVSPPDGFPSYRSGFGLLWNSIHGEGAWQRNEWVTVISFNVIHANIDAPPTQGESVDAKTEGAGR